MRSINLDKLHVFGTPVELNVQATPVSPTRTLLSHAPVIQTISISSTSYR